MQNSEWNTCRVKDLRKPLLPEFRLPGTVPLLPPLYQQGSVKQNPKSRTERVQWTRLPVQTSSNSINMAAWSSLVPDPLSFQFLAYGGPLPGRLYSGRKTAGFFHRFLSLLCIYIKSTGCRVKTLKCWGETLKTRARRLTGAAASPVAPTSRDARTLQNSRQEVKVWPLRAHTGLNGIYSASCVSAAQRWLFLGNFRFKREHVKVALLHAVH